MVAWCAAGADSVNIESVLSVTVLGVVAMSLGFQRELFLSVASKDVDA